MPHLLASGARLQTVLWRSALASPLLLLGYGCASGGNTDLGNTGDQPGTGGASAATGGTSGARTTQGTGGQTGSPGGAVGAAGSSTGAAGTTSSGGTKGTAGASTGQAGTGALFGGGGTSTQQGQGGTSTQQGQGGTSTQGQGGTSTQGSIPTTCAEADGSTGCCGPDGNLYYCSSNAVKPLPCSSGSPCGWDASKNYYSCGGTDAPPASSPMACGASSTGAGGTSTAGTGGTSSTAGTGGSSVGAAGSSTGPLSGLDFAIVGDTRPANEDDTAGYPTAIITKIWQQVQAQNVPFAVATGDYQFASPSHTPPTQMDQLNLYLGARQGYAGPVYFTMGNHECTGATADMCGPGSANGTTLNLSLFTSLFLAPLGQSLPYYTITKTGANNAWTAKFVIVALNYWNDAQSTWLTQQMAIPTTYTFVVRHEGWDTTGITSVPLCNAIIQKAPMTLLIAGHTHTYEHEAEYKEVIVGNGGAPLSGNINYGYVIATQQSSGAIQFQSYDTTTNAVIDTFAVNADGSAAP